MKRNIYILIVFVVYVFQINEILAQSSKQESHNHGEHKYEIGFSGGLVHLSEEKEKQFVTHLELTYESELKYFGIGPVVGYGVSRDDNHYMIGLHIGKGF